MTIYEAINYFKKRGYTIKSKEFIPSKNTHGGFHSDDYNVYMTDNMGNSAYISRSNMESKRFSYVNMGIVLNSNRLSGGRCHWTYR